MKKFTFRGKKYLFDKERLIETTLWVLLISICVAGYLIVSTMEFRMLYR